MPPRLADPAFDRRMMQWLVVFSSSEGGRRAAEAWLAAFDAARQAGADEAVAYRRATRATRASEREGEQPCSGVDDGADD